MSGQFIPLRDPVFRAFWVAAFISQIGAQIQNTGVSWLMASLTDSALLIGLVKTASGVPLMLLAPFVGTLVDVAQDRRKMLIATQVALSLLALLLAALTFCGIIRPWGLLLLLVLFGIVEGFNWNCWQKIMANIVSRPQLPAAVSLNIINTNVGRGVGPALAGILMGGIGIGAAFFVNSLAYFGTILVALRWKQEPPSDEKPSPPVGQVMREGLRYVLSYHLLLMLLIRNVLLNTSGAAVLALLPLVARQKLGLEAEGFGILVTAFGCGCLLGAVCFHTLQRSIGMRTLTRAGLLVLTTAMLTLALSNHFWAVLSALFIMGSSSLLVGLNHNLRVRLCVPEAMTGRAIACYLMTCQGGFVLGGALFGALAGGIGLTGALVGAAIVSLTCFLLALAHPMPDSIQES